MLDKTSVLMYNYFFKQNQQKKRRSYARKKYQQVRHKAIKKNYPDWKRLTKKEKKLLAKKVLDHVLKNYDYSQSIDISASFIL